VCSSLVLNKDCPAEPNSDALLCYGTPTPASPTVRKMRLKRFVAGREIAYYKSQLFGKPMRNDGVPGPYIRRLEVIEFDKMSSLVGYGQWEGWDMFCPSLENYAGSPAGRALVAASKKKREFLHADAETPQAAHARAKSATASTLLQIQRKGVAAARSTASSPAPRSTALPAVIAERISG
jgi:hypothetical protein